MERDIVAKTHKFLLKNKLSIAVAESCTGGLVSKLLIDLPGSSTYFLLGLVTYNNAAKRKLLKIPASVLAKKGAVSEECATLMAQAARRIIGADIGVGVTGIAGPTGGTLRKPVGTVFIAIAAKNRTLCREFHFTGARNTIRTKSALKALKLVIGEGWQPIRGPRRGANARRRGGSADRTPSQT